jgi:hypothetical protein
LPCARAHRPLPSMMMAMCRGNLEASRLMKRNHDF